MKSPRFAGPNNELAGESLTHQTVRFTAPDPAAPSGQRREVGRRPVDDQTKPARAALPKPPQATLIYGCVHPARRERRHAAQSALDVLSAVTITVSPYTELESRRFVRYPCWPSGFPTASRSRTPSAGPRRRAPIRRKLRRERLRIRAKSSLLKSVGEAPS